MAARVIRQRFLVGMTQLIFNGSPGAFLGRDWLGQGCNLTDSDIVMPEGKE
jgi:hypothetical protein